MATLVSAMGIFLSVLLDLPTGATIVTAFGGVLVVLFIIHLLFFHGPEIRHPRGAASVERPQERV